MTRQIVLDTETTGLDPLKGDRVIEIAAIELSNLMPTGRTFHVLLDPERDVPAEAARVHGITTAQLRGKPRFAEVAPGLLDFLGDGPLVAHNAQFDFGFLDAEFARLGLPPLAPARMVDTLFLARTRFPGLPNSLDALCRRFGIDLSERTSHNALLDCRLLAQVYVELTGGRQRGLELAAAEAAAGAASFVPVGPRRAVLVEPTPAQVEAHRAFLAKVKDPLWTA